MRPYLSFPPTSKCFRQESKGCFSKSYSFCFCAHFALLKWLRHAFHRTHYNHLYFYTLSALFRQIYYLKKNRQRHVFYSIYICRFKPTCALLIPNKSKWAARAECQSLQMIHSLRSFELVSNTMPLFTPATLWWPHMDPEFIAGVLISTLWHERDRNEWTWDLVALSGKAQVFL